MICGRALPKCECFACEIKYISNSGFAYTYLAYKHQLVKAIDLPTLGQEGDFAEILLAPQPEASIATGEPAVPAPAPLKHQDPAPLQPKPRFATLTEAEVDSVASARTAKNTNEQTKWGTKIFKGMFLLCT